MLLVTGGAGFIGSNFVLSSLAAEPTYSGGASSLGILRRFLNSLPFTLPAPI